MLRLLSAVPAKRAGLPMVRALSTCGEYDYDLIIIGAGPAGYAGK